MSASRSVFNVTLHNPISHTPSLTLHGKFNIISITETFMGSLAPSSSYSANFSSSGGSCSFVITLVGQQGHVIGGVASGNVTTANKVVRVVATFMNPSFHRLPSANLVVHDSSDAHGNPRLGGVRHGGAGAAASAGAGGSEWCSNTSMSISGHGVSSPAPSNSLAPSDVVVRESAWKLLWGLALEFWTPLVEGFLLFIVQEEKEQAIELTKAIPLGFKFVPPDRDLIHYLLQKSTERPLPCDDMIKDYNLYGEKKPSKIFDGELLEIYHGVEENIHYTFTILKKTEKGALLDRTTGTGT
ncbi:hypothetical protein TEA_013003 [Camellia sinensis var. sinensis]|uniref:NAC domain-containing protein n=1 Tax=Camellia sinensis var. sinensis TaxID=542762 RepID=A0A4S4E7W5_CAMSN|nr:hypothetical protein TEA_013003 [Camellia sinensis var. sinensis]